VRSWRRGAPAEIFQEPDLLRNSNIEPPVLAELFQRLERSGHRLGRPQSPEEARLDCCDG
jgi:hypothetical protein